MKKLFSLFLLGALVLAAGCRTTQESAYNRDSKADDYEHFLSKYVFAACQNEDQPYALYSLATLLKRPSDNDPRYKVRFVNGPCQGQAVFTTNVILKTEPVGNGELLRGTVLLRNYRNPKKQDTEKTDRWNLGVVTSTARINKGIIDLSFPRDKADFSPAREGVYIHNVRYIVSPEIKDVRTFIH